MFDFLSIFPGACYHYSSCISNVNGFLKICAHLTNNLHLKDKEIKISSTDFTSFKNEQETEFAQILDTYNIEWIYEPKTFPIEWDPDGNVRLAFSPDFYLPGLNLYIELTAMSQKYVTEKNKKAKKLMELYPGTNIKIVYKKDFQSLIERFSEFSGQSKRE